MAARILIQLETLMGNAIAMRDRRVLSALTHPSFTYLGFHPVGMSAWSRAEWLISVGGMTTLSFVHSTIDVQALPAAAVVSVDALWVGDYPGAPSHQRLVISDFWVKSEGRWRLLRRHASTHEDVKVATRDEALVVEL